MFRTPPLTSSLRGGGYFYLSVADMGGMDLLCGMFTEPKNDLNEYLEKYDELNKHIELLKSASIVTLDFRPRLMNPLAKSGIRSVNDLLTFYRDGRLKRILQIGKGAFKEIEERLKKYDLIGME